MKTLLFALSIAFTLAAHAAPQAAWQTITVSTNGGGGGTGNMTMVGTPSLGDVAYWNGTAWQGTNHFPLLLVDELTSTNWTASTVLVTDGSTNLVSSVTTAAEVALMSGASAAPEGSVLGKTGWTNAPAGGIAGTLVTNDVFTAGDLYAAGSSPTNAVKATSSNVTNVLGHVFTGTGDMVLSSVTDAKAPLASPALTGTTTVNGTLVVGTGGGSNSVDSVVLVSRAVNDTVAGNGHAFSDSSIITRSNGIAYNSYDIRTVMAGTNRYDHVAGFQFIPTFTNSVYFTNIYGAYIGGGFVNTAKFGAYHGVKVLLPPGNTGGGSGISLGLEVDSSSAQATDNPISIGGNGFCLFNGVPLKVVSTDIETTKGYGVNLIPRAGYGVDSYGKIASSGRAVGTLRNAFISENWEVGDGTGNSFVSDTGVLTGTHVAGWDGVFRIATNTCAFVIKTKGLDGYVERARFDQVGGLTLTQSIEGGVSKVLASSTASSLFYISIPNTNAIGGDVIWTVTATDGTDIQQQTGRQMFGAGANGTAVGAQVDLPRTNTAYCSAGTLTVGFAANVATNNVFALQATATTSLTTTNLVIKWRLETPSTFTVNAL